MVNERSVRCNRMTSMLHAEVSKNENVIGIDIVAISHEFGTCSLYVPRIRYVAICNLVCPYPFAASCPGDGEGLHASIQKDMGPHGLVPDTTGKGDYIGQKAYGLRSYFILTKVWAIELILNLNSIYTSLCKRLNILHCIIDDPLETFPLIIHRRTGKRFYMNHSNYRSICTKQT